MPRMRTKATVRISPTIDAAVAERLDAYAKASGQTPAAVIEDALTAMFDTLPILRQTARLVAEQRQAAKEVEEMIGTVARYVVDARRTAAEAQAYAAARR
jgi:hypothetical protein